MKQPTINAATDALQLGGVVAHATEGVWGLACDPFNRDAVLKVLALKAREMSKGLIVIAHDALMFQPQLDCLSDAQRQDVLATWPGSHTWILPACDFPDWVTGGRNSVACRVPGHTQARELCQAFGGALVSTSANRSGQAALTCEQAVRDSFAREVDVVLAGEVLEPGQASRIHTLDGVTLR